MAQTKNTQSSTGLYIAFELGSTKWVLASAADPCVKTRRKTLEAGDLAALAREFDMAKKRFKLPADAPVFSCYEAGRDGFWLHRWLETTGVNNIIVDSASIEVNRRSKTAKTDRLDATKLLSMLFRYSGGEKRVWQVLHVPDEESEDARRFSRELDRLKKEHGGHWVRIQSLLCLWGIKLEKRSELAALDELRSPGGKALPAALKEEIRREWARLLVCQKQLDELAKKQEAFLKGSKSPVAEKTRRLSQLKGVGWRSSSLLVLEFFGWRKFRNRRQVGALAGMVATPYLSDQSQSDQGISKSGNKRVRAMMIELSWLWLRWQPQSALSRWYQRRFGHGSKRMRRVGIVALGRKLLIAFWRYLEFDQLPEGAILRSK